MNPFWIGLAVGLVPFGMLWALFRLLPKTEKQDIAGANDLLRDRNHIGRLQVNQLTELANSLREIAEAQEKMAQASLASVEIMRRTFEGKEEP